MSTKIHMDVHELQAALDILNNIPSMLEPGGGASVSDLAECQHISECLSSFGNGGNGGSWISQCTNELYNEIRTRVDALKAASSEIGARLKSSMDSYSGTDTATSHEVKASGNEPTAPAPAGRH
jgi:hypothetical protein